MRQRNTHIHTRIHDSRPWRRRSRLLAMALLAIALPATVSEADADKGRRKPVRPSAAIDNEGPLVVIREARTLPGGDQNRLADPGGGFWLPWRPAIRLDLILPIHTPPARPVPGRP